MFKSTIRIGLTVIKKIIAKWFNIRKYIEIHMYCNSCVDKEVIFNKIHSWVYLMFSMMINIDISFLPPTVPC